MNGNNDNMIWNPVRNHQIYYLAKYNPCDRCERKKEDNCAGCFVIIAMMAYDKTEMQCKKLEDENIKLQGQIDILREFFKK